MKSTTIIFNELNQDSVARYTLTGCEKAIIVRSDLVGWNMNIDSISLKDPRIRPWPFMGINNSGDYPIFGNGMDCGQEMVFTVTGIAAMTNLFVEIIYETCNPEECCPCK